MFTFSFCLILGNPRIGLEETRVVRRRSNPKMCVGEIKEANWINEYGV